jgi:hypothetical protein
MRYAIDIAKYPFFVAFGSVFRFFSESGDCSMCGCPTAEQTEIDFSSAWFRLRLKYEPLTIEDAEAQGCKMLVSLREDGTSPITLPKEYGREDYCRECEHDFTAGERALFPDYTWDADEDLF